MAAAPRSTASLTQVLGHAFADPALLDEALTHPSVTRMAGGRRVNYERLEFLGDRVLGLAVADLLLRRFPDEPEGKLAVRLSALVRQERLVEVAGRIGLGGHIRTARADSADAARAQAAALADCCEAVIGALFVDGGWPVAQRFVETHWTPLIAAEPKAMKDAKTALQEWAQGRGFGLPRYEVVASEGPDHSPSFSVSVAVEGAPVGATTATGSSKRAAEQAAAEALLAALEGRDHGRR
ncbi:MAG: ribonuclease III [Candidatus Eiseniibacteriota bacterium]